MTRNVRLIACGLALVGVSVLLGGGACLYPLFSERLSSGTLDEDLRIVDRSQRPAVPLVLPKSGICEAVFPDSVAVGWPNLAGPTHDYRSPERGLALQWSAAGPREKWRKPMGTGYSAPVVLGNRLILLHREEDREIVECLDAENGHSQWARSWPTSYECPYNYSSGPYSTPALDNGRAYVVGAEGKVSCLTLDNGKQLWRRDLHQDYDVVVDTWPAAASPLLDGPRVIMGLGARRTGAGVIALDASTGETLWTATKDGASCSTPCAASIHGRRFLFVWTAEALVALDPASGGVHWRIPFCANDPREMHGTSPIVVGDLVFVSGYKIGNLCVRVLPDGNYREVWRDRIDVLDSHYKNLIDVDGTVCGFSTTRSNLRCLELVTGEVKWKWRSRILKGNLVGVDGHYLLWGEKGRLASLAITANGVEVLAMTPRPVLSPPCFPYPALHNGLLYLRNDEQLLCVDLRRKEAAEP